MNGIPRIPSGVEGFDLISGGGLPRDRLLGIVEARCKAMRNGATWQVDTVRRLEERGGDRTSALGEMTRRYRELMHANVPVHEWPDA